MTHKPLAHPGIGASIPKYVSRNAYFITMRAPGTQLVWNHLKGGAPMPKNAQYTAYLLSALYSVWLHLTALIYFFLIQGKILPITRILIIRCHHIHVIEDYLLTQLQLVYY